MEVIAIPAFEDNYIWLLHEGTKEMDLATRRRAQSSGVIVDPGLAEPVISTLKKYNISPCAILITHHHSDHIGGIRGLIAHYKIPVYGPANESIPSLTHSLQEGQRLQFSEHLPSFEVLETPGHTRGHIVYYGHGMLFCGDTLFGAGCGRLFEGSAQQMHSSLNKIRSLPNNTNVYCAHEYTLDNLAFARVVEPENPDILARFQDAALARKNNQPTLPSTLELEKRTNPFLRYDVPAVITAAEHFAQRRLTTDDEVFAVTRYWKDVYDAGPH